MRPRIYDYNANNSKSRLSLLNKWNQRAKYRSTWIGLLCLPVFRLKHQLYFIIENLWQQPNRWKRKCAHKPPLTHTRSRFGQNAFKIMMKTNATATPTTAKTVFNGAENMFLSTYKYLLNAVVQNPIINFVYPVKISCDFGFNRGFPSAWGFLIFSQSTIFRLRWKSENNLPTNVGIRFVMKWQKSMRCTEALQNESMYGFGTPSQLEIHPILYTIWIGS